MIFIKCTNDYKRDSVPRNSAKKQTNVLPFNTKAIKFVRNFSFLQRTLVVKTDLNQ